MLENLTSVSLFTAAAVIGPMLLGCALIYGIMRAGRRTRAEVANTEAATARLYKREDEIEKASSGR